MPFDAADYDRYNKLMFAALAAVAAETDLILVKRKLWRNHHKVLEALARLGPMGSLAELAEAIEVSKQALNSTLRGVVREGLVCVESDPANKRVRRIRISDEGKRLVALLAAKQHRFFEAVCDEIGRDGMEQWARVMTAVRDADARKPDMPAAPAPARIDLTL